jgi:hypothetical protein
MVNIFFFKYINTNYYSFYLLFLFRMILVIQNLELCDNNFQMSNRSATSERCSEKLSLDRNMLLKLNLESFLGTRIRFWPLASTINRILRTIPDPRPAWCCKLWQCRILTTVTMFFFFYTLCL